MICNGVVLSQLWLEGQSQASVMTQYMAPFLITYGAASSGSPRGLRDRLCGRADAFQCGLRLDHPMISVALLSDTQMKRRGTLHLLHHSGRRTGTSASRSSSESPGAEVGVRVTTDLMTMFGGTAFPARPPVEIYFETQGGSGYGTGNDVASQRGSCFPSPHRRPAALVAHQPSPRSALAPVRDGHSLESPDEESKSQHKERAVWTPRRVHPRGIPRHRACII